MKDINEHSDPNTIQRNIPVPRTAFAASCNNTRQAGRHGGNARCTIKPRGFAINTDDLATRTSGALGGAAGLEATPAGFVTDMSRSRSCFVDYPDGYGMIQPPNMWLQGGLHKHYDGWALIEGPYLQFQF
ncbi:unnamed protein product [Penicillium roqueforti FM164]|uniref:Genomic scaffold, ProqFM164S02 n=1 Tax=Penicillium roqueforti (strain FM164) TaxID=1365484 RepID=W6Q4M8_PENRF|nr:unnamed protein product [Penicillium roqueforti FM164]